MKVILSQTVPKVGKEGQVVNVADGFARNYLFPRGYAVLADKKQLAALQRRHIKLESKLIESKADAEALKEKLNGQTVRILAKAGSGTTKLFGAVTSQDVVDAIREQLNVEVEKKRVGVLEPIKRLGTFLVEIDLHRDVDATISVEVYDPDFVAPETEALPETPAEPTTAEPAAADAEGRDSRKAKAKDVQASAEAEGSAADSTASDETEEPEGAGAGV
jgi:large subunit ribosomal protein L9